MAQLRQHGARLGLVGLWAIAGGIITVGLPPAHSAPIPSAQPKITFQQPNTAETSAPRDRPRGGGTRPICTAAQIELGRCSDAVLAAVVPFPEVEGEDGETKSQAWGQTITPAPTLWFHIPYPAEAIHSADFELLDSQNQLVAAGSLAVTATPGIVSYTPALDTPLAIGETYYWSLLLRFDPAEPAADELVSGRITRVAPSAELTQRLGTAATPLQQAEILGEAGIWYDTVTALAAVHSEQPVAWTTLLRSVGLDEIVDAPVLDCCDASRTSSLAE